MVIPLYNFRTFSFDVQDFSWWENEVSLSFLWSVKFTDNLQSTHVSLCWRRNLSSPFSFGKAIVSVLKTDGNWNLLCSFQKQILKIVMRDTIIFKITSFLVLFSEDVKLIHPSFLTSESSKVVYDLFLCPFQLCSFSTCHMPRGFPELLIICWNIFLHQWENVCSLLVWMCHFSLVATILRRTLPLSFFGYNHRGIPRCSMIYWSYDLHSYLPSFRFGPWFLTIMVEVFVKAL